MDCPCGGMEDAAGLYKQLSAVVETLRVELLKFGETLKDKVPRQRRANPGNWKV